MTDNDILADNNIKHFGKLSTCYEYLTDNIKDAITFIDLLPEIFKENRNGGISTTNLQEFVN